MLKDAIVLPLVTVLATLFRRPLDVSWGPTHRASGGRSGTLRDTWRVAVRFMSRRVFCAHPALEMHFNLESKLF